MRGRNAEKDRLASVNKHLVTLDGKKKKKKKTLKTTQLPSMQLKKYT